MTVQDTRTHTHTRSPSQKNYNFNSDVSQRLICRAVHVAKKTNKNTKLGVLERPIDSRDADR